MDVIDKRILISLQEDVSISLSELSKKVGISSTPCWSRIKKLENDKVIAEDERFKAQEQVQKLTDKYIKNIEQILEDKEKELVEF